MATTISATVYVMAEARALHNASGLWHYVRAYGVDDAAAREAVQTEAHRRSWILDQTSIRLSPSRKGEF